MSAQAHAAPLPVADGAYAHLPEPAEGLPHRYGPRVHLLSFPYPMTLLARLCAQGTEQPEVNRLVVSLYDWMLAALASRELVRKQVAIPTRMVAHNAEGVYQGEILDPDQRVIVVDIARAGMLPSMRVYDGLNQLLNPAAVRQDHVIASRVADERGRVTGVRVDATKIGGPAAGATVIIPDPMAATGTSAGAVIRRYLESEGGPPRKVVCAHLIVTPEYLAETTRAFPNVEIYAIRVDRGLSSGDVLGLPPGERWEAEHGLNDHQYIVPGGGGFGEIMNNAWI